MLKRSPDSLKKREQDPAVHIPYTRHVTPDIVALRSRALMTVIRIEGVSFETADNTDLNILHNQLNMLWRNIANEHVALWSHAVRSRERHYPEGNFTSNFARQMDDRYRKRMVETDLYRNDLYLSVIWHPGRGAEAKAKSLFSRLSRARKQGVELDEEAIKGLEDTTRDIMAGLSRYDPVILKLQEREGIMFSEPMEFLQRLLSGEDRPVPLVCGEIASAIYQDRVIFGREAVEVRGASRSRYAGIFGIKEYPATTRPGMLDGILAAPFELVLTQSYGFMSKADAKTIMTRKQNQMVSSNDRAASQMAELDDALDDLESNRFVFGEHHLVISVMADSTKKLLDNMSAARSLLATGGAVIAREDLGLEAAFWSQLPGNFKYRARSGAVSSRNFASLAPFHSYPQGHASGNHWGEAVSLLKTASASPFYFNFHQHDLGNTFVCGPSGSGKTVFLNFSLTQLQKHNPQVVFFDKDRGADIFIRAIGGAYLPLKNGVPTGCAPLKALDLTPENRVFLGQFIRKLAQRPGQALSASEERSIDTALNDLASLPQDQRTIGALRSFLDTTTEEGIAARLEIWEHGKGRYGWVFDCPKDSIRLDARSIGFDMTDFLDNDQIRTPLMMYLFYRVEQLIDGRRIVIVIDEFWKALGDEAFRDLAQNKLKTIRKQNGFMLFATQSPADAIKSPIAHTIIEQCPTQVFFPNPRGSHADYVSGFKLTNREFDLLHRDLTNESRQFIVKQGHNSIVTELNLKGFDEELAVLSGRTAAVEVMEQAIEEAGPDPDKWLPIFQERNRNA